MNEPRNSATHGAASAALSFSTTPRNIMNFTTHNTDASISINGTSLQGQVTATYKELTDLFGKPFDGDGYKVDAEWALKFEDGTVATIYNWKNGKNYCGNDGLSVEQIKDWHVGGASKASANQVQIAIDLHREAKEDAAPKDKVKEAMTSAIEIMDSLKATKGAEYATAVEVALNIRKQAEIVSMLTGVAMSAADMPKTVAEMIGDMHNHMSAKILAKFVKLAIPGAEKNLALATELMGWVDKVMDAEQTGVKSLLKDAEEE